MHCPFDGTTLLVVDRSGIEIDWCPTCKGVWLERGELDQLIDRVAESHGRGRDDRWDDDRRGDRWDDDRRDDRRDDRWDDDGRGDHRGRRRRGGLLAEIFDL